MPKAPPKHSQFILEVEMTVSVCTVSVSRQDYLVPSFLSSTSLFWGVHLQSITTLFTSSAGFNPKSYSEGSCYSCEFDPENLPDEILKQLPSLSCLEKKGSICIALNSITLLTRQRESRAQLQDGTLPPEQGTPLLTQRPMHTIANNGMGEMTCRHYSYSKDIFSYILGTFFFPPIFFSLFPATKRSIKKMNKRNQMTSGRNKYSQ